MVKNQTAKLQIKMDELRKAKSDQEQAQINLKEEKNKSDQLKMDIGEMRIKYIETDKFI